MSDKFGSIFHIASAVGKQFLPPAGGAILDAVNETIGERTPGDQPDALRTLAADNDSQTQAILALSHVVADLKARVEALEAK